MIFQIYIKLADGNYKVYNSETDKIITVERLRKDICSFTVPKKFAPVHSLSLFSMDDVLYEYSKRLILEREEILNCETLINKFDIMDVRDDKNGGLFYKGSNNLVLTFFKFITKPSKYNYFDKITLKEYYYFEKTKNCGLTYTKTGIFNCFGYDYKNYYGSILGNRNSTFKIPTKEGIEKQIEKLPKYLQYGFYKVKIISNNENFNKVFIFNKENIYCHYDIQLAREFENVSIELILNEINSFVYYSDDLISSYKVFNTWYETIISLKKELNKTNSLIKLLSSSLWGYLSGNKIEIKTEDEFFNDDFNTDDYIIINQVFKQKYSYFELINKNKSFYKTDIRLKPFITSFARCKIARTIKDNNLFDSLIRIHTDSVCLSHSFDFSKYNNELIPEEKTTGKFEFVNINEYRNLFYS